MQLPHIMTPAIFALSCAATPQQKTPTYHKSYALQLPYTAIYLHRNFYTGRPLDRYFHSATIFDTKKNQVRSNSDAAFQCIFLFNTFSFLFCAMDI